jgi:biotin operon repressor
MLYEELSQRFGSQMVQPFKEPVVIIDSKDFRKEWEEQLKAEGCKILVSDYLGRSCFLIRKPQASNNSVNEQLTPQPNVETAVSTSPQNIEEAITELIREGLGFKEIQQRLGLTHAQLMGYMSSLRKKGVLQRLGWVPMRKRSRKPSSNSRVQIPALKFKDVKPSLNASLPVREMLQVAVKILNEHPEVARFLIQTVLEALT